MKKIYKISIGVVIALILIVGLTISSALKGVITTAVRKKTGLELTMGTLWINPFSGVISSKDISVSQDERELLLLKSFKLDTDPLKLMGGKLYISELTLIEPTVDITKEKTTSDTVSSEEVSPVEPVVSEGQISPSPAEDKTTVEKKESFIKEIVVKNITIEALTLKGEESAIKSLNTLTLEVPDFIYKDDILDVTATLDVVGSGVLDLTLKADTSSGEAEAALILPSLTLNNSFTTQGETLAFQGLFDGLVNIRGNYMDRSFTINGNLNSEAFTLTDSEKELALKGNSLNINIENLTYPDITMTAAGSYDLIGHNPLMQLGLKDVEGTSGSIEEFNIKGGYRVDYPLISTAPEVSLKNLNISLEGNSLIIPSLEGRYGTDYNIDSKSYDVSGTTDITKIDYKSSDGKTAFSGNLAVDLGEFTAPDIIVVRDLTVTDGQVVFEGQKVDKLNLNIKDFSAAVIDSPLKVSGNYQGSPFKGDLKVRVTDMKKFSDLTVKGDLSITSLKMKSIEEFLKDVPYDLSGVISYDSYIDYSPAKISASGSVKGQNFKVADRGGMDLALNSFTTKFNLSLAGDKMNLRDTKLDFNGITGKVSDEIGVKLPKGSISIKNYTPQRIDFSLISLTTPDITVREPKKSSNATPSKATSGSDSKSSSDEKVTTSAPKKVADEPLPIINIASLGISGGRVTQITPDKTTILSNIKLNSKNFSTQKGKPFTVDTSLAMDGIKSVYLKGQVTLKKDWDFDPKELSFDGSLGVTSLNLPEFNREMADSLPNEIKSGTLNSTGTLKLNGGKVDYRSKVKISDLTLGAPTGVASRVPLDKVVKALKDNNGDINITVPVKGDLNDPEFTPINIVIEVLITNFTGLLKTPEKAISSILTIGGSDKENVVYFDYLESEPKYSDIEKLTRVLDLLKANSSSKVKVTIFTNDKVEEGIMKSKDIANILFGKKKKESTSDKLDDLMDKRKSYITDFFSEIDSERVEVIISDRDKNLPQAKLELIQ